MMNLKSRIRNYILQNVTEVRNPKNPHKAISFSNLGKKIDLLFWVLDNKTKDDYLKDIANLFYNSIENIVKDPAQNVIFESTGQLARSFEKFVKKIGFIRIRDEKFWNGNKSFLGIKESSLHSIYSRKLDVRDKQYPSVESFSIPLPLVRYSGIRRIFLDIIARDFDITLGSVKKYTKKEIIEYSKFVIGCYLIVVEDNFDFLYRSSFPGSSYINKIISRENFSPFLAKYVELFCEKVVYSDQSDDSQKKVESPESYSENEISDINAYLKNGAEKETILHTISEVFDHEKKFILMGDAGSGKSTSLLFLFYKSCLIFDKNLSIRSLIPLFIKASDYGLKNKFVDILQSEGQGEWIQEALHDGRIVFFIDGLNEIDEGLKSTAYDELNSLMKDFSECKFILSARNLITPKLFDLPCYRLQAFKESQIEEFLKKNVDTGYERLFRNIIESENLNELASNPLLLGIITSLFNSGTIPDCEGLLFDAFFESLLTSQKFFEVKIDKDFMVDVLSKVAFWLKQSKRVSCDIEEFHLISKKSFDDHAVTGDFDSFIDGLCKLQIIRISEKQSITFFHESYLDYFAAKAILKSFRTFKDIDVDLSNIIWHKPILMCGDLSVSGNISEDFADFLFQGRAYNKLQKPLNSFTGSDFNENLLIACKVANNLRVVNPDFYRLAEVYVSNALVLWMKIFSQSNHEPIPLELLFGAIAALNSERLIRKILTEEKWLYLWLYDQNTESNSLVDEESDNFHSRGSKFNLLVGEYARNTPDFSLTLKIINQQVQSEVSLFFTSIHHNLIIFRNFLLQNVPIRFLVKYYKEDPDYDVLWYLSQRDWRSLGDGFELIGKCENVIGDSFYLDILKAHSAQVNAYKFIFDNIHLLEHDEPNLLKIIDFSVYHQEATELLIQYFDGLVDRDCKLFNKLLFFIRKFPWISLSERIRSFFTKNLDFEIPVRYETEHSDSNLQKVVLVVNRLSELIISNKINHIVRFHNGIAGEIISYTKRYRYKRVDLICLLQEEHFNAQINSKGILTVNKADKHYCFKYQLVEISVINKTLTFSLDHKTINQSFEFLELKKGDTLICNNITLTLSSLSINTFQEQPFDLILNISGPKRIVSIPQKGEFEIIKTYESIIKNKNYSLFHPEQFTNTGFIRTLTKYLSIHSTLKFIEGVGICHLFTDKLKVHLGIVKRIKYNVASVFSFDTETYIDIPIPAGKILTVEDIVVLEKDGSIVPVDNEVNGQLKYEKGYVISVDESKQSGFIRNVDTNQDYFFSLRNVNVHPNTGDKVRFLKIKNRNLQYEGMQIAVKISKIPEKQKICVIISSHVDVGTNSVHGESKDTESGQIFRFNMGLQDCGNIRNLLGIPLTGKYFSYFLSRKSLEQTAYPKIRLIEFLIDEN